MAVKDGVATQGVVYIDPVEDATLEDAANESKVQDTAAHDVYPKDVVSVDEVREDLEDKVVFAHEDGDASRVDAEEFAGVGVSKLTSVEIVCFYQSTRRLYPFHDASRHRNDPIHEVEVAFVDEDEAHDVLEASIAVEDDTLFHAGDDKDLQDDGAPLALPMVHAQVF